MTVTEKPKRNPQDYINVCVPRSGHNEITEFLDFDSYGGSISKFYHRAAMKELQRLKQERNPLSLLSTQKLIECGWRKEGGSAYKRGKDIVFYDGIHWYLNNEKITNQNFSEEIISFKLSK